MCLIPHINTHGRDFELAYVKQQTLMMWLKCGDRDVTFAPSASVLASKGFSPDVMERAQVLLSTNPVLAPALPVLADLLSRDVIMKKGGVVDHEACFATSRPSIEAIIAALILSCLIKLDVVAYRQAWDSPYVIQALNDAARNEGGWSPLLCRIMLLWITSDEPEFEFEFDAVEMIEMMIDNDSLMIPVTMYIKPTLCFYAALTSLRRCPKDEMARRVFGHSAWTLMSVRIDDDENDGIKMSPSSSTIPESMLVDAYQRLPLATVTDLLSSDAIYTLEHSEIVIVALAQLWWRRHKATFQNATEHAYACEQLRSCVRVAVLDEPLREALLPRLPWWSSHDAKQAAVVMGKKGRDDTYGFAAPLIWGAVHVATHDFLIGKGLCLYKGLVWRIDDGGDTLSVRFPPVLEEVLEGLPPMPVLVDFALSYVHLCYGILRTRIKARWNRIVQIPGKAAIEPVQSMDEDVILVHDDSANDFVLPYTRRKILKIT